jgi:hypothetical protein
VIFVQLSVRLMNKGNRLNSEIGYTTEDHVMGFSTLVNLSKRWSLGTEMYYTAKERSGGCE